jgi:hypothetical protein
MRCGDRVGRGGPPFSASCASHRSLPALPSTPQWMCWLAYTVLRISLAPQMTRYVVLAVGQDFYFDASRGAPYVDDREEAKAHC